MRDIDDTLPVPLPWAAPPRTAAAIARYRRRAGRNDEAQPDLVNGADAAVSILGVLTHDSKAFRRYLARLEVAAP